MTEDRTLTPVSKKLLPMILVLVGGVALTACSSKPSPWTESSSPWDERAQNEPVEEGVEPVEDDGLAAMEEEPLPVDNEFVVEEPLPEPEPMMVEEPEPVMSGGGLAAQPAGNYAVQVVASSSMEQLRFFANQYQLSDEWVAETTVNGKVWYILMLGVYETKAEAEQALVNVQDLETQPWIRTIGSVQAVMN